MHAELKDRTARRIKAELKARVNARTKSDKKRLIIRSTSLAIR